MKIAVIADIHGNIHALDAVLDDIERQNVDQIIVNGDLVNRGPNNIPVLERVMPHNWVTTLGNHDDLMVKWIDRNPDIPADWFDDPFWSATALTARELADAGWTDRLRDLPMTHAITLDGAPTVLVSHGSPRNYREGFGSLLTEAQMQEIIAAFPAQIYVGSHIHATIRVDFGEHTFLNTGSVGAPYNRDPRAQYLVLTLVRNTWEVEFRAIEYDREAALNAFQETAYLERGGLSAQIFFDELYYARVLFDPFWRWLNKEGLAGTWHNWEIFKQNNADRFVIHW